jgi:RNA polymerase sigma-70 factor (ECF subfamily)
MKQIIDACIKEDRIAQRILYDTYSKKMLGVCIRYATDIMEAEDILQEGFIKVFNNISQYTHKGSFEGWIRRIMVNTAINKFRARKNNLEYKDELNFEIIDESYEEPNDKISYEELLKLIDKLPIGYKTVFNLYAIDGFSHKEIAEKLNHNESTSRTQYYKSKKYLIKLINDEKY